MLARFRSPAARMPRAPLTAFLVGALLVSASTPLHAAATSDAARKLAVSAGATCFENGCLGVTFSIPATPEPLRIEIPSARTLSLVERTDEVFTCGPGAFEARCDPNGARAAFVMWNGPGGGFADCPPLDFTYPGLVAAARYPLAWQNFERTDRATWSASAGARRDVDVHAHGERITSQKDTYVVWHGDPSSILPPARPDPLLQRFIAFENASPTELPSPLREVYALHAPAAVLEDVEATVTAAFTVRDDAGATVERSSTHELRGTIAADGRFHVEHTRSVVCESEDPVEMTELLAFDGATFFHGSLGAPYFHAYGSSAPIARWIHAAHALLVRPLIEWARSPFGIELAPGFERTVERTANSVVVRETFPFVPGASTEWSTLYTLDARGAPRVTSIDVFGPGDELLRRTEFSEHRELAPGTWRPFRVVERAFEAGALSATTTTVIHHARVSNAAVPSPAATHARWFVHL